MDREDWIAASIVVVGGGWGGEGARGERGGVRVGLIGLGIMGEGGCWDLGVRGGCVSVSVSSSVSKPSSDSVGGVGVGG